MASRPADWYPLRGSDPVPGDPDEVAAVGSRLRQTALLISDQVNYLRSLCTDEFWDSDAGRAFRQQVDGTAASLWKAHHRYYEISMALGWSPVTGPGYAPGLAAAQASADTARRGGQDAWAGMQRMLSQVVSASHGKDPYAPAPGSQPWQGSTAAPRLNADGTAQRMPASGTDDAAVTAAKRQYNALAADFDGALARIAQAARLRDEASAVAERRIRAAIDHDGLADGFLDHLESGAGAFLRGLAADVAHAAEHPLATLRDVTEAGLEGSAESLAGPLGPLLAAVFGGSHALAASPGQGAGPAAAAASGEQGALQRLLAAEHAATGPAVARQVWAWWTGLSAAQRQRLIDTYPDLIGALDGLPAAVRDEANRGVLYAAYAYLAAERERLAAQHPASPESAAELAGVEPKLKGMAAIIGQLSLSGQYVAQVTKIVNGQAVTSYEVAPKGSPGAVQYPNVYLLGFDTNNLGHAIVSYGNPDTAQNMVTYVPGLGSQLSGAGGDMSRAFGLYQQAEKFAPGVSTASVYWLNYDAPQLALPGAMQAATSVATAEAAVAGAPALDSFAFGLTAAHQGQAAHTVMLGHSYGSLVVGKAAVRAPGQLAGDLAFIGSPGVGVNSAADLGIAAAHVFAGQAGGDPVPDLPPTVSLQQVERDPLIEAPIVAAQLAGGLVQNVLHEGDQSHFGTNPAAVAFGGKDFSVAYGSYPMWTLKDHSTYWDPNSASLKNLAHIVDGQYGNVTAAPQTPTPVPPPWQERGITVDPGRK